MPTRDARVNFKFAVQEKELELASASASAEKGVSGAGLMTTVQPAASAGPSLRVIIAEGKFHGVRIELKTQLQLGSSEDRNLHTQHLSRK
jgi:hypothetical protein